MSHKYYVTAFTCTKEQAMVPLLSWFSRVSHTATSGTLVTPSVIMMMPETHAQTLTDNHRVRPTDKKLFFCKFSGKNKQTCAGIWRQQLQSQDALTDHAD